MAQRLKHLPGMWETLVQSLDWEDPLEKELATHSNTLAWRIPWREELGRLQSMGYIVGILTGSGKFTREKAFQFLKVCLVSLLIKEAQVKGKPT